MADDNAYYVVRSAVFGSPSWYGTFTQLPAGATALTVSYAGKASRTCTLALAAFNWSTGAWTTLAQQPLGTGEVGLSADLPAGVPSPYRSTSGLARVRVTCSLFSLSTYTASTDLLTLAYRS